MIHKRISACGCSLLALLLQTGCADWSYRTIQIGQTPSEYARVLPIENSRKTALGLCSLQSGRTGRTDAIVVFLTEDRRVAAKFWTQHIERNWGFGRVQTEFRLEGELSPQLYGTQASGPLDTLRAVIIDLNEYRGEKLALETHAWIAGGLIRLMQCWPGERDVGTITPLLKNTLDSIPGGGTGRMEIDQRGYYQLRYRQGGGVGGG